MTEQAGYWLIRKGTLAVSREGDGLVHLSYVAENETQVELAMHPDNAVRIAQELISQAQAIRRERAE